MPRPHPEFKAEHHALRKIKTKKENRRCKICNSILSIYNLENECFYHKLNKDRDPDRHEKSFGYGCYSRLSKLV